MDSVVRAILRGEVDDVLAVVQGCGAVIQALRAGVLAHIELADGRVQTRPDHIRCVLLLTRALAINRVLDIKT